MKHLCFVDFSIYEIQPIGIFIVFTQLTNNATSSILLLIIRININIIIVKHRFSIFLFAFINYLVVLIIIMFQYNNLQIANLINNIILYS